MCHTCPGVILRHSCSITGTLRNGLHGLYPKANHVGWQQLRPRHNAKRKHIGGGAANLVGWPGALPLILAVLRSKSSVDLP